MLTARAIMTENISAIHPEATIQEAIDLLLKLGISGLPVCDDQDRLIGITEYAMLAIAYDDKIQSETVAQHMTTDVLSVNLDDPISKAADICALCIVCVAYPFCTTANWPV